MTLRELCVSNRCFDNISLHKYTRVAKGEDVGEVKSVIDQVLVKKYMLCYLYAAVYSKVSGGIS